MVLYWSRQNAKRADAHARKWSVEETLQRALPPRMTDLTDADEDEGDDAPFYKYTL